MQEQNIDYYDGDCSLNGTFIYPGPKNTHTYPAIILFHAFEGRGEFVLNYARKLALAGYVVFVADMYGNATTSNTIDGCFKLLTPFLSSRELVRERAVLAYNTLVKHSRVSLTKIGAMGFCFGGMCVLELLRSGAAQVDAGITAHGVLAKSELITKAIKASLLILHGYKDPQVPPQNLNAFAEEMEAASCVDWSFIFFGNAKHSFTDKKTGSFDAVREKDMGREYDQIAAERTYRYALDFFNEKLL